MNNLTTIKAALTKLLPIIPTRSPLPILSCVRINAEGDSMTIEASNLDQYMQIKLPHDGPSFNVCCGLRKLLQVPGGGDVEIIPTPGQLSIKGNRFSSILPTLPASEFPSLEVSCEKNLALDACYTDTLKWVAKAIGADETQPQFTGVGFNELGMCGCDRRRLSVAPFPVNLGIIIPGGCIEAIAPLLVSGAVLSWSDSVLIVEHEDTKFLTKTIAGEYPNVGRVIPNGDHEKLELDADELRKALKLLTPGNESPGIDITCDGESMTITAKNDDAVNTVSVPCVGVGTFRCSRNYLIDALAGFNGDVAIELRETTMCIRQNGRCAVVVGMITQTP